jgi:hypothetical protein
MTEQQQLKSSALVSQTDTKGLFPLRGGTATKVPDFNEFADYIKNGSI